ncbi:hypothetical protein OIU74_016457 [Salix koriyanagi]|uniref:Uncharacterized protein n=1 Tax=Salix koriyanagi TaxID=2511006 RepID=A0A9Q0SSI0_9ROSI|nr:hypothetical protein OIU74_016457 [Salix koriyanagi]
MLTAVEDFGAAVSGLGFEIGVAILGIYFERESGEKESSFRLPRKEEGCRWGGKEIGNLCRER